VSLSHHEGPPEICAICSKISSSLIRFRRSTGRKHELEHQCLRLNINNTKELIPRPCLHPLQSPVRESQMTSIGRSKSLSTHGIHLANTAGGHGVLPSCEQSVSYYFYLEAMNTQNCTFDPTNSVVVQPKKLLSHTLALGLWETHCTVTRLRLCLSDISAPCRLRCLICFYRNERSTLFAFCVATTKLTERLHLAVNPVLCVNWPRVTRTVSTQAWTGCPELEIQNVDGWLHTSFGAAAYFFSP